MGPYRRSGVGRYIANHGLPPPPNLWCFCTTGGEQKSSQSKFLSPFRVHPYYPNSGVELILPLGSWEWLVLLPSTALVHFWSGHQWRDPHLSLLSPDKSIPVSKSTHLPSFTLNAVNALCFLQKSQTRIPICSLLYALTFPSDPEELSVLILFGLSEALGHCFLPVVYSESDSLVGLLFTSERVLL